MENTLNHISFFSGEGGFDLASELTGWNNIAHCEKDPFCLHILKYYWPNAKSYKNIIGQSFRKYRGIADVLSGGFPCQPYSVAGDRRGIEDDRHLWPEMFRAIREILPRFVVGENVSGIINWGSGVVFEQVCADLESAGYKVQPFILPACAVDAPHRRDRVFFIACRITSDSGSNGLKSGRLGKNKSTKSKGESEGYKWERIWNDYWGNGKQGTTPNAGSNGLYTTKDGQSNTKGNDNNEARKKAVVKPKGRSSKTAGKNIGVSEKNISSNTIISRLEEWQNEYNRRIEEKIRQRVRNEVNGSSSVKYVAYTCDEGLQRRKLNKTSYKEKQKRGQQSPGSTSELYKVADWSKFPTQSPVCSRNDGISSRLDTEAISKMKRSKRKSNINFWREESLKCHGNAVVVPLIVELFKIIDFMDYLYKTHYND